MSVSPRPLRTWMHLDEVQVFAASDQQTNLALRQPCSQSSSSNWSSRSIERTPRTDARHDYDTARRVLNSVLHPMAAGEDLTRRRDSLATQRVALDDRRWDELYQEAIQRSATWNDVAAAV